VLWLVGERGGKGGLFALSNCGGHAEQKYSVGVVGLILRRHVFSEKTIIFTFA